MRGKKKTKEEKKLDGTFQPYREVKNEFLPTLITKVSLPDGLKNDYAKEEWRNQTNFIIKEFGGIASCDLSQLFAYCNEMGCYVDYMERAVPEMIETKSGYLQVNPYITEGRKALNNAIKIGKEFGFTPIARQKMESPKPKEDIDPMDEII